jgi:hypothetical protein
MVSSTRTTRKIIRRYLPKILTQKDRKLQKENIIKSRKAYKHHIYLSRPHVKSFPHRRSKHLSVAEKMYGVEKIDATRELSKASGCSVKSLKKVINKGAGAYYSSGSRPNQTAQSWGIARLASSLTAGKAGAVDYNILNEGCKKGSLGWKMAQKARRIHGHGTRRVPAAVK